MCTYLLECTRTLVLYASASFLLHPPAFVQEANPNGVDTETVRASRENQVCIVSCQIELVAVSTMPSKLSPISRSSLVNWSGATGCARLHCFTLAVWALVGAELAEARAIEYCHRHDVGVSA